METIENYKRMTSPIFEVFNKDKSKHFKIYEDGGIDGFGEGMCIINRIPSRSNYLLALLRYDLSSSLPNQKNTLSSDGAGHV